jgi:hypothetical protein
VRIPPIKVPTIPALGATGPVSPTLNGLGHILHFLLGR